PRLGGGGDGLRQLGDGAAGGAAGRVDQAAQIDVARQLEAGADQIEQRTGRGPAVAPLRKQAQPLAADPVGGSLVAEDLAPAAGPRAAAFIFAISDRTGAGGNDDAVLA